MTLKTNIQNNLIEAEPGSLQLNILIFEDGLEYAIYHKDLVDIAYLKAYAFDTRTTNPVKLEAYIQEVLDSDDLLNVNDYDSVKVSFHNQLATIIPNDLYDPNNQKEYLKYGVRLLEGDKISVDDLPELEAKVVYIPYVNITNNLLDKIGQFEFYHASGILAKAFYKVYKKDVSKNFFVNINNTSLDVFYFEEGKLQYFNSFLYSQPEDLLYYVLFSMEQLGLSTDSQALYLTGNIDKKDIVYELLYNYIRKVRFLKEVNYVVSDDFYGNFPQIRKHHFFALLNLI